MEVINPHRFAAAPTVDFDGFGNASRYFDGVSDYIYLGDSDDFSFGDGVNDSPFSVCAWVNMVDATNFRILTKFFSASTAREWQFVVAFDDRLYLMLYDDDGSTRLGRRSDETYTSNQNSWVHFSCTYDGSSISSGISLYRTLVGGSTTQVDAVDQNIGTYTAMHNTTANVHIGRLGDLTTPQTHYANGNIADVRIYNKELSSAEIQSIADGENITTNLVGHWLKDTPSLLDHSGTNDGTNNGSAFAYDNPSPAVEFGKASRSFDGVNDYIDLGDSDDFTFGDGVNDSAFSVCGWVKMTDATLFRIACKQNNTATGAEWLLSTGGNDKMYWALYDESTSVYRGLISDTTFTSYEGQWVHIAATYDGTGGNSAQTGMTIYLTPEGGSTTTLTTTDFTNGTYTAMHNTIAPAIIGEFNNTFTSGSIADMRLYSKELSSAEVQSIANGTHLETNLIGHWLTNTDDVKDYAGVNDGTNFGSTYSFDNPLSEGEFGSASRDFNGSQYIEVTDDAAFPTGSQTWSCWVKVDNTSGIKTFVAKNIDTGNQRGGRIRLNNAQVQVYISADGNTPWTTVFSSSSLSANTWYHLAMVFSPSTHLKIYIDGVEDASNTTSIPSQIYDNTAPFCIGSLDTTQQFQVGNIADVRIYDTDLTATDIFNLSRGYDYRTNLIGQWLTNKDDVDDYAGTNHGTNNGSTYSQDAPL